MLCNTNHRWSAGKAHQIPLELLSIAKGCPSFAKRDGLSVELCEDVRIRADSDRFGYLDAVAG